MKYSVDILNFVPSFMLLGELPGSKAAIITGDLSIFDWTATGQGEAGSNTYTERERLDYWPPTLEFSYQTVGCVLTPPF